MKAVANLNDFVREHMLEPADATDWVNNLIAHFEALSAAHDSVVLARAQIAELEPILADCDRYADHHAEATVARARRGALRYFFAQRRCELLAKELSANEHNRAVATQKLREAEEELTELRRTLSELELRQAGLGGNEITALTQRIDDLQNRRNERKEQFDQFQRLLADAGLAPVTGHGQYSFRRHEIEESRDQLEGGETELENTLNELRLTQHELGQDSRRVAGEIASLRGRTSNIPRHNLEIRERICAGAGLDAKDLPFAGELITVREDQVRWEGAAERVLRGFGLSLLVSFEHYGRVSQWINDNHLRGRVVYFKVPARSMAGASAASPGSDALAYKLDVKESPFANWIDNELLRRARHICAETMDRFRTEEWAVTPPVKCAREAAMRRTTPVTSTTAATTSSAGPTSRKLPHFWKRPLRCSPASMRSTSRSLTPTNSAGQSPTGVGHWTSSPSSTTSSALTGWPPPPRWTSSSSAGQSWSSPLPNLRR